ncbi:MAG: leucyl aminopeptidase family protein [Bacteroidales bacterium]|nr:leucyl aminopeptidase family protein [Bacteroidales bacterium]MBR7034516.1 leucyl aminopeptidase family protein [Bacteroidales bacterium]
MEIVFDSAASVEKYQTRIFLVNSLEDASKCGLTDFEQQLLSAKATKFSSGFLWVEAVERVSYFVVLKNDGDAEYCEKVRKLGCDVFNAAKSSQQKEVVIRNVNCSSCVVYAFLEGFTLSQYSFGKYSEKLQKKAFDKIVCCGQDCGDVAELNIILRGVFTTKDLINEPNNICTAEYFAEQAVEVLKNTEAQVFVRDKKWIENEKMGGLLAVNRGSVLPPRFVHIVWNPKKDNSQPIVLVGKGIVFDAGGLSLKPNQYMETMKSDMSGAATVLGTMKIVATQKLPIHVEALIPLTDNRPGENAMALGDIITMHNGKTVEILNADAEGRLILADALSYAASLNPQLTIDVATLTGAANQAVGEHAAVYFSTASEQENQKMEKSGFQTWEPLVKFPLWAYYDELISSNMADMKNTGGQYGGAISAAKFLQQYVSYPWIHLDIAGSAYFKTKWSYKGVGATGFGVRTLYQFLKMLNA